MKQKGTRFENEAVEVLMGGIPNSEFKRVVGSGAIGTTMNEPLLTGDISGEVKDFPKRFRGEAKSGYNTLKDVKSVSVRKEWIDKIRKEASGTYSFPFLICKFDNVRIGTKQIVVLDVNDFMYLINLVTQQAE